MQEILKSEMVARRDKWKKKGKKTLQISTAPFLSPIHPLLYVFSLALALHVVHNKKNQSCMRGV